MYFCKNCGKSISPTRNLCNSCYEYEEKLEVEKEKLKVEKEKLKVEKEKLKVEKEKLYFKCPGCNMQRLLKLSKTENDYVICNHCIYARKNIKKISSK